MRKALTIGLAAAALAGGVAGASGAAQAADWNRGGYGHERYDHNRYDRGRYDRDHWRGDRDGWGWRRGWRGGYRYGEACRSYRVWSPYYGRYVLTTRCD